jgi:hypothetical protein
MKITVQEQILDANDTVAAANRALLDSRRIHGLNLMASPARARPA